MEQREQNHVSHEFCRVATEEDDSQMKEIKEIVSPSFNDLYKDAKRHHQSAYLWKNCLSIRSQFCEAVVTVGFLTWEQMVSAACRYRLGCTRQGGVIFWQIDQEERVRDGKVMYYGPDCHRLKDKAHHPTWVSAFLRQRDPFPNAPHQTSHCFFGTHLLRVAGGAVAVVEAEKTAVILSEVYPQFVWLAAGGLGEVQVDKFRPLRGHKVILFPDTDPDGIAFKRWSEAATAVMQQPFWEDSPPIRVSSILELRASPAQKARKIDLVDFIFDAVPKLQAGASLFAHDT